MGRSLERDYMGTNDDAYTTHASSECSHCKSRGFGPSLLGPNRCQFCDGTEAGVGPKSHEYVYAGFRYHIVVDYGDRRPYRAIPAEGQHPAASKEKHMQAAMKCWEQEHGR